MTGLHNRRSFEDELKRLNREEKNLLLCIIMADVNGLKLINDSFGHKAGDVLLSKFAKVLKKLFPSEEMLFRIGGDEFVILIPNCNREQADELVKTIKNIINTLHEKNKREEQHSRRVAELCEKLANALQMPEHELKEIKNAGLLHDIGKIAISENLLNKPGKLTMEEFEEVRRHPEIGYRILCSANEMTDIAEYVLAHHERWDGEGYPRGLAGENIPLQARIIAIADTFDAMTSIRSYREPVSEEDAAKELMEHAGTQFDPELVRCFVQEVLGYRNFKKN